MTENVPGSPNRRYRRAGPARPDRSRFRACTDPRQLSIRFAFAPVYAEEVPSIRSAPTPRAWGLVESRGEGVAMQCFAHATQVAGCYVSSTSIAM
jgi:hypothetical protein